MINMFVFKSRFDNKETYIVADFVDDAAAIMAGDVMVDITNIKINPDNSSWVVTYEADFTVLTYDVTHYFCPFRDGILAKQS